MIWFKTNGDNTGLFSKIINGLSSFGAKSHHEENDSYAAHEVNARVSRLNAENDIVSAIRKNYEKNVIRTKLNIQSQTGNDEFDAQFEKLIKEWSKKGNCEITGRYYRGLAERKLVAEAEVLSGGFILRHHYSKRFKHGYKFEIIPLSAIDRTKSDFTQGLFNGIQTNKYGEISAIYIYTDHKRQQSKPVNYRELTLHVNIWIDVTQYSGTSPIAPILATLDILDEYTLEEIKGAKNRASNNLIVKTHFYAEIKRIAQEASSGTLTPAQLQKIYDTMKLEDSGDIRGAKYIPKEDEVVELGKSTQSIFGELDMTKKRALSVGVGMSPMSTVGEMPSSYNATLYFAQKEEGTYEIALEDFVELSWREVIEVKLLKGLILSGHLLLSDYWDNPAKYEGVEFMRATTDHIDPVKTQKATTEGIVNKSKNMIDVLASSGVDYQKQISQEVKYELARKKAFETAGLIYVQTNLEQLAIANANADANETTNKKEEGEEDE